MNQTVTYKEKRKWGFTTGSCATAAAKAAAQMLFSSDDICVVRIVTPNGRELNLDIIDITRGEHSVCCGVIKDAGDDPDVTNGMKIYATVSKSEAGIHIDGGVGVGRVTKAGLRVPVGEAAINPVPRRMIQGVLEEVKAQHAYEHGFRVVVSVPGGEAVAAHTFNSRLGIVGGISILGTTGIVMPMSEQALVDTIKVEMDVQKAANRQCLLIAPGNYGLHFLQDNLAINLQHVIKCANFLGETIDYASELQFESMLLVGHVGKLLKLAGGIMNTHSKMADGRMEILAAHAGMAGAGADVIRNIMGAPTTEQALAYIAQSGLTDNVVSSVQEKIEFHLHHRARNNLQIEFIVFAEQDRILMQSAQAQQLLKQFEETI